MLRQYSASLGAQPPAADIYYPSSGNSQSVMTSFGADGLENHIRIKLAWLYNTLQRSEKYQKYREKQPVLTPAEVVARDAADKKERERREAANIAQSQKETTVWPDFLENAFWRALVRWPPMGRKKYMLAGVLKGRNELIQDSIYRETGITRDRKQISSHIQVLKGHLKGFPIALAYMGTLEESTKLCCGGVGSLPGNSSHLRHHQHTQGTIPVTKDGCITPPHIWPQHGSPHPGFARGAGSYKESLSSSLTVVDFTMQGDHQAVHCAPRMHSNSRLDNVIVTDVPSWCHRHLDSGFLETWAESWKTEERIVLICDAFIRTSTEGQQRVNDSIALTLHSCLDLSRFESLKCTTHFHGNEQPTLNQHLDSMEQELGEYQTSCHYVPDSEGLARYLRIEFGFPSFFDRLERHERFISVDESSTRTSLPSLTATQDVYGHVTASGETQCLFTILWRFYPANHSAKASSMQWRSFLLGENHDDAEYSRYQGAKHEIGMMDQEPEEATTDFSSTSGTLSPYHLTPELPMGFSNSFTGGPSFEVLADNEAFCLSLSPEVLSPTQLNQDQPSIPTLSTASDQSQQGFALPLQDALYREDGHEFGFDVGNTAFSTTPQSAFDFQSYRNLTDHTANPESLYPLSGFDHREWTDMGLTVGDEVGFLPVTASTTMQDPGYIACSSTKPTWQHTNLIANLETAAEQYQPCFSDESYA